MEKFYEALFDRSLSVLDKLKVACYLWKSSYEPKSIIKWTCEQICSTDRKKSPDLYDEVTTHLFKLLSVILRATTVEEWCPVDSLFTARFFKSMSEAFLHTDSEKCHKSVMDCLQCIVTGSSIPSVLFKFELMVSLFRSILHVMALNSGAEMSLFLSSLIPFLRLFEYVQTRHGNQKKMFTVYCDELLEPVLLVRTLLTSAEHQCSSADVTTQLDSILQQMFNRETLTECPSAVSSPDWLGSSDKQTATSYVRVLFTSLHSITCSNSDCPHRSNRSKCTNPSELGNTQLSSSLTGCQGTPTLLETFLLQNSREQILPRTVEFKFFQRLLEILVHSHPFLPEATDMESEGTKSERIQSLAQSYLRGMSEASTTQSPVLQSLAKCLSILLKYEVYNPGEDGSAGGEQKLFLEELVHSLLLSATSQDLTSVLSCLTTLLQLNHKLVEPWLPLVWMYLSTDVQKGDQFAQACLETYWKLRQLPLFICTYLESMDLLSSALSLCPLPLHSSPSLSKSSESLLAKRISSLPPGQCVEMMEHFYNYFTQRLNTNSDGGDQCRVGTGEPLVVSVIPSLEKAADMLSVVLSSFPLSLWTSHLKEKALTALLKLHKDVSLPFLEVTFTKKCRRRLSTVALCVACATTQLLALVKSLCPDLLELVWLPELVWCDSLSLLVPKVWSSWLPSSVEKLGPTRLHLLKRLAIVQLKTKLSEKSEGDDSARQTALCVFQHLSIESKLTVSVSWSGQTFDLRSENSEVAHWHLLLSHLSLLLPHTSEELLAALAADITTVIHSTKGASSSTAGLTVSRLLREFLSSVAFLEMASLHELLLNSILTHIQAAAPRSFLKSLSISAVASSDSVFLDDTFVESLSTSLSSAIDLFQERGGAPMKKHKKWLASISTSLELLEKLPFRCLGPVSLQRVLSLLCAWYSSFTLTILSSPEDGDSLPLFVRVSYLLGWVLQCLSLSPLLSHAPKSSKSKRESVAVTGAKFTNLLDLMCEWLCRGGACLCRHPTLTENSEFLTALWITVEMAVDVRVKVGGHPNKLLETVSGMIGNGAGSECQLAEKWLHSITLFSCKYCQIVDPSSKRPHPDLEQLCGVVSSLLEGLMVETSVITEHPLLVSSLAALLKCRPELVSPRVLSMVESLRVTENPANPSFVLELRSALLLQQQLNVFKALIDAIYLSAVSAQLKAANDISEGDISEDQTIVTTTHSTWTRLHSSLTHLFRFALDQSCQFNPLEYLTVGSDRAARIDSKRELVFKMVYEKITTAMKEVAAMASRDELSAVIEELSQVDVSDRVSVCTFCVGWKMILNSKLKQPCREGLRRHYSKIVLLCQSAALSLSTNILLVTGLVELVTSLASLPSRVGLDNQSIMVCLQMCSLLKSSTLSVCKVRLLEAVSELMASVCRQHTGVMNSAPAPVITAVIKLIHEVVATGQDVEEQLAGLPSKDSLSAELRMLMHCAGVMSRTLEMISHQVVFCKYVMYILHEFIVTAYLRPLHSEVKESLLPGVFSLVKLASPGDIAFLKSPLDSVTRENCQTLLDQYKQYYKFGGRV